MIFVTHYAEYNSIVLILTWKLTSLPTFYFYVFHKELYIWAEL